MLTEIIEKHIMTENGKKRKVGDLKFKSGAKAKFFDNILNIYIVLYFLAMYYEISNWRKKKEVSVTFVSLIAGMFASLTYGLHAYQQADAKQLRNTLISISVFISVIFLKLYFKIKTKV